MARIQQNIVIRAFTPDDHPAAVEIHNLNRPEDPVTLEDRQQGDAKRDPKYVFERFAVELEGRVVAYGTANQNEWLFHPQKFVIYLQVHREFQNRGIGGQLYDFLLGRITPHNPNRLISTVQEDKPAAVHFAQKRGFAETMRSWESKLEVRQFDFSPYTGYSDKVQAQGYRTLSMAELGDTSEARRKMWELEGELVQDVPMPEPSTWPTFERYTQQVFESKDYLPQAIFFALAPDGEWAGMSELWSCQQRPELRNGITGVRRAHRRKGLALALKLRGLEYAQSHNIEHIWTTNESNNLPILAINERLGFVRQPAAIDVAKDLA